MPLISYFFILVHLLTILAFYVPALFFVIAANMPSFLRDIVDVHSAHHDFVDIVEDMELGIEVDAELDIHQDRILRDNLADMCLAYSNSLGFDSNKYSGSYSPFDSHILAAQIAWTFYQERSPFDHPTALALVVFAEFEVVSVGKDEVDILNFHLVEEEYLNQDVFGEGLCDQEDKKEGSQDMKNKKIAERVADNRLQGNESLENSFPA